MKILIGCEESQIVTMAFRNKGFDAYSCDLKDCSGGFPEYHLKMDVMDAIDLMEWDMIGLHPECTKMTCSGNRHYAAGKSKYSERLKAVEWTIRLYQKARKKAKYVYMENPIGAMNKDNRLPKPQVIHPFFFGDPYKKATCLWLKELPKLIHQKVDTLFELKTHVEPRIIYYNSKKTKNKKSAYCELLGTLSTRGGNEKNRTIRSKTFPGIAKAMAEQWGNFLKDEL